jgi:hypothetical protein
VKDVIDLKQGAQPATKGAQPAISGKLLDTYNDLPDGLVQVAILVPPGAIEKALQGFASELPMELPPELPMELPLDALTNIDTVGITLAKEDQSITASLELRFTDSDSAKAVENMLNAAIGFASLMPGVPEEDLGIVEKEILEQVLVLLNKLEVDTTDSCLTVSLELTLADIENLMVGYGRVRTQ